MRMIGCVLRALPAMLTTACTAGSERQTLPAPDQRAEFKSLPADPGLASVATLADIAGEWDIVSFDGHSPARLDNDGQRHAYVDIGAQGLRFAIGCNHASMAARIEGGVLVRAAVDRGMQTAMGCGRERERRDETFFGLFLGRPEVTALPNQRLRMATSDHELSLERSSIRRLAMGPPLSEIMARWRVVGFTRFENGGHRGWGAMYAPGRLRIADGVVSYSRCLNAAMRVTYTTDYTLRRNDGSPPARSVECGEANPALTEIEPLLAALLGQSPEVERVNEDRFILRTRDYAVLLTSEAAYRRDFGTESDAWERNPG